MNRLLRNLTLVSFCTALGLWVGACDSATPTAPTGTILTITANPSQIGLNGTSQITVIGRRPDGNPLNPGTEIFFSTSRGTITPTVNTVNDAGIAVATLRGDGRPGTASVTASVSTTTGGGGGGGGGEGGEGGGSSGPTTGVGSVSTSVLIGQDPDNRPTALVSASPSTVFVNESSTITIVARTSDGSPVTGETVILTSTLGDVSPARPRTGNDGTATATLRAGSQPGTATVTALVGSSEPATTTVTIQDTASDINVIPEPGTIPQQGGTIEVSAFVINSQGEPVPGRQVTFGAEVGQYLDGAVAFTNQQGQASATLTVTEQQLGNRASFFVEATTASASGDFIEDEAVVTVQGR